MGQEIWFTDGSGLEGQVGCAAVTEEGKAHRKWQGDLATVCDGEVEGIAMALENAESNDTLVLADSQAAIQICLNATRGKPARTAAERRIAVAARRRLRAGKTTEIGWVKAHEGIEGNELADVHAKRAAEAMEDRKTVTAGGIRQRVKQERKEWREEESYGKGRRVGWDRRAMSNFTQLRTGKGPFRSWLHRIRQRESARCAHCRTEDETGDHIVFGLPAPGLTRAAAKTHPARRGLGGPGRPDPIILERVRGRPGAGDDDEEPPDQVHLFFLLISFGRQEEDDEEGSEVG